MANTLTGLVPTMYEALDIVSRELVGFIPAVSHNASAERAALNQIITIPVVQAQASQTITPGVTPPDTGDQTIGTASMAITKSKMVPIRWNGEQQRSMMMTSTYNEVLRNQFAQAFRTLTNEIEVDLFTVAYQNSSRATGTAGVTPLGTAGDISGLANVRQILDDNGAPQTDLQFVMGSAMAAVMRGKQSLLLRVNESGSAALLRRGSISELPVVGFDLHNSGAVSVITKGTGASYVTSGSTAANSTSVVLVTGTGTVLAGDVVTFAADTTNAYVVNTGVAAPGTIVIGAPGNKVVIPTGNAMTVGGTYTPNMAFSRSAIQLISRVPASPIGPNGQNMDLSEDSVILTDPVSGLSFEIALYAQYRQMQFQVMMAWGVAAIKSAHISTLMG